MEIVVDRSEFVTELTPMQGIVERKSTIPVLSHLLLSAKGDKLQLAATDLDVSLTSWVDADIQVEGGIAVQAKKFMEIIRSLVGETVSLKLDEPKILTITGGTATFKIHGMAPEDFPSLPEVEGDGALELPFGDLKRMISKVLYAVSVDESRFQLNGALLKIKGSSLEMVATDGHRLTVIESKLEDGDDGAEPKSVLVPRKALQELQRFDAEGEVGYRQGEHHLSFRVGRRELICRILEGSFPDYDQVIARDNDKEAVFERKRLSEAVQRVALLTGDRARGVRLELDSGAATISAANPDLGEASEELPCEYENDNLALALNPDYLGHFLAAVETDKVLFKLKNQDSQCVGYPVDGADERYLCVIMPMRL